MKRFVNSETFVRARLVNGALFAVLGAVVGVHWQAVPGVVLGLAMLALGIVRFRDFRRARGNR